MLALTLCDFTAVQLTLNNVTVPSVIHSSLCTQLPYFNQSSQWGTLTTSEGKQGLLEMC